MAGKRRPSLKDTVDGINEAGWEAAMADISNPPNAQTFYVEIRKRVTDEVVKRLGPATEKSAERIQRGAEVNLNHDDYYTEIVDDSVEDQES